ncbi:MAG: Ig-like domain-containing protein [Deltaproteobacteria bacterium]
MKGFIKGIVCLVFILFISSLGQTVIAEERKPGAAIFKDVSANNVNAVFITYLVHKGVMGGFPDGTFRPGEGLTRAQAATVLVKAAGLPAPTVPASKFSDVPATHWAAASIAAAAQAGYLSGFPDGTFRPDEKLTRAQGISLVMRICTVKERAELPALKDMNKNHWAAADMGTAIALEMVGISADGQQVYPDANMSRGALARALAILMTRDPGLCAAALEGTAGEVTGKVDLIRAGKTESLKDNAKIRAGDIIKTGNSASVRISYPDGSSNLITADSEIKIKISAGRYYIKQDGGQGIAVDELKMEMPRGTIYGSLATKYKEEKDTAGGLDKRLAALDSFNFLAAAGSQDNNTGSPWYKTAQKKKVKVTVDMPWGIAGIRGTNIKISCKDGKCEVACLNGNASLSGTGGSGQVDITGGQRSEVNGEGKGAENASGFNAQDKKDFSQGNVQAFFVNVAKDQTEAAEAPVLELIVNISDQESNQVEESEKTIDEQVKDALVVVVEALESQGIELQPEVINDLSEQIKETLKQEEGNKPPGSTEGGSGGGGIALTPLTITAPTLTTTRVYDGTTSAAVTPGTLSGVIGTDVVTVSAVASYDNKNVGSGKTITVVYTLNGADAAKYSKPSNFTVTSGVITAAPLTISAPSLVTSKVYDGSTALPVTAGTLSGVCGSDIVYVNAIANYDNANAGTGKTITVVYAITGADFGNYTPPASNTFTGSIIEAMVNLTAIPSLEVPVAGAYPTSSIATVQYTSSSIVWTPTPSPYFDATTVYTATITLTPQPNYTFNGIPVNYFTVAGASSVTNAVGSGVVIVQFPATSHNPFITGLNPANNSTAILAVVNPTVTFNENIALGTGTIALYKVSTGTIWRNWSINDPIAVSISGNTLTLNPDIDLSASTEYYIRIDNGAVRDTLGNEFTGINDSITWRFTTAAGAESIPPTISSLSPANNSTGVLPVVNFTATFDENVAVGAGTIAIYKASDSSIWRNWSINDPIAVSISGNTLTLNPDIDLSSNTGYYVRIDSGAVRDTSGNEFAGINDSTTWRITTEASADSTPPTISSLSPANNSTAILAVVNPAVTFNENIALGTGTIALYKVSTGSIWRNWSINDPIAVSISGNKLTLNPDIDLSASTEYYIRIDSGAIRDTSGNEFGGINDSTTWRFTTAAGAESIPPAISSLNPANSTTGVLPVTNLTATFDENVAAGTGTIAIYKASDNSIWRNWSINDPIAVSFSGNTLTLNPDIDLSSNTEYYVRIDSGAVRDTSGNEFSGINDSTTWRFTTAP